MNNTIFAKNNEKHLTPLSETLYESEDYLQKLIEDNPVLLAGEQINPIAPRKWILISREMGIPNDENSGAVWSIDHLFLDQDGIPTLVEVKRSTDTRIRREVVGQMLDYASSGSLFWKIEDIKKYYNGDLCVDLGLTEEQYNDYWNTVDNNLRLGKIRLIFAADEIPETLERIIEFLNNQMHNTEVLGLEIKQFTSNEGNQLFMPRIIGKTLQASEVKGKKNTRKWDKASSLDDIERTSGKEIRQLAEKLITDFENANCRVWYGTGSTHCSFIIIYDEPDGTKHHMFSFYPWTSGNCFVELYFQYFKPPYDTYEEKIKIARKFEDALGITIKEEKLNGRPSLKAQLLLDEKRYCEFKNIIFEMIHTYRTQIISKQ